LKNLKSGLLAAFFLSASLGLSSCQTATDMVLGKGSYQMMENARKISKTRRQYRTEIKPVYMSYIMKKYADQILRPQAVKAINLGHLEDGYSYELINLLSGIFQKYTVASNNGETVRLKHSIKSMRETENLKTYTTLNRSGTVVEEPYATIISSLLPIYAAHKCSFVIGECTFTSIRSDPKKQTAARDYKTNTTYKNGVWYSTTQIKGKAGYSKLYDSERIYDQNGFPLFIYQDKAFLPTLLVRNDPALEEQFTKHQAALTAK